MNPSVSIFTPTNNPQWLGEAYDSIKDQPFSEWVIVPNNLQTSLPTFDDPRVKVYPCPQSTSSVGFLKWFACNQCNGDILVELDHDDLLLPGAIQEIINAFSTSDVGFVYSNSASFRSDFSPTPPYDPNYGWAYRTVEYKGHKLNECVAFPPDPASVSRIWYAPNHVRCWRKKVYDSIGGHSVDLRVNDDQELVIRTYLNTRCVHIDKCLYLYRRHDKNTCYQPGTNQLIQEQTMQVYDRYIFDLATHWARGKGLSCLNLGGRLTPVYGYTSVDKKDAQVETDLDLHWPFADNTVGVVLANDILEHLRDKLHAIQEIYRVLAPGGFLLSRTPSTDGRGAFQDPTHISYYNENSFLYYTNRDYARYIDTPVRFQATRLYTTPQTAEGVCWVVAHLVSLKDGYRPPGLVSI